MLKRPITYKDFNGEEVTETFYFHISEPELIEFEVQFKGGVSGVIEKLAETNDRQQVIALFKEIILMSYGEKSEDGRRFIKNEKLREEFSQTAAFSSLFMEMITKEDAGVNFIKGILPAGLMEELNKALEEQARKEQEKQSTSSEG